MFFPLLAGLAIAFSLQLLLTNLGIALGLSAVGLLVANANSAEAEETAGARKRDEGEGDKGNTGEGDADEGSSAPVTHLLGLGVTLSVAPVLFAASFLATEFSQLESLGRGAIFGTILWSVYLLIVTWLSSKTVSGVADVVLGGATAGIRKLFSAVKQISSLGSATDDTTGTTTKSLSEAERIGLIARELGAVMSTQDALPMLITQRKADLVQEMSDRAHLSPQQAEAIIGHLSEALPQEEASSTEVAVAGKGSTLTKTPEPSVPHWRKLMRMGLNQLDVTDWDLESAWNALQTVKGVQEALPFNIISLDVEDYLSEIPQWVLASDSLETDLIERLYDPEADPELVRRQLKALKPEDFMQWLVQRGDLSDETIQSLGGKLSGIYHSVLETVEAKRQTALAQSSKAASATRAKLSDNGGAIQVLKQLGTTAEKAVSKAAAKIDAQRAGEQAKNDPATDKKGTDKKATDDHTLAASQSQLELTDTVSNNLKIRLSEVQNKLLSYFRYTTLDKLTAESVGEKLKSQLEASDLLTESGKMALGGEPLPQAVKGLLEDWMKASMEELETVIGKRKGMTKKHCAVLQKSLQSAWEIYGSPLVEEDSCVEGQLVEGQSVEGGAVEGQSVEGQPVEGGSVEGGAVEGQSVESQSVEGRSEQSNAQQNGFPRRWAKRAAQRSEKLLAHTLDTGDWQQKMLSQLVSVGDKGTEAVEDAVGGAFETVETAVTDTLEAAQGQFNEAIASAQQKIDTQVEATKHELKVQAEAVRHQAAIAAWWLFASLLTSELAAAGAGWLAVRYPVG